jgi:hypothetical protein
MKARATGPGPLRTARGAGRRALDVRLLDEDGRFLDALEPDLLFELLPVLRDRALELLLPVLRVPVVDVLLLRDPGGEDVRVAMLINLIDGHTCHRDHRMRVAGRSAVATVRRKPSGHHHPYGCFLSGLWTVDRGPT